MNVLASIVLLLIDNGCFINLKVQILLVLVVDINILVEMRTLNIL